MIRLSKMQMISLIGLDILRSLRCLVLYIIQAKSIYKGVIGK